MNIVYDTDDPLPEATMMDSFWYVMNRLAEWGMFLARLCGLL